MRRLLPILLVFLGLTACNVGGTETPVPDESSSSSSEDIELITYNVSYSGVIDEIGVTIYQQGTHRLTLEDDAFLLLESTDANLNLDTYLGKRVEIHGSLQPTVEEGGLLLRVQEVIVLDLPNSSSSETGEGTQKMCGGIAGILCEDDQDCVDDPSDSCDPMKGGVDCSGICVPKSDTASSESSESVSSVSSLANSSVATTSSSRTSSSAPTVSSSVPSSVSSSVTSVPADSAAMEEQNALLAKQTYDQPSLWTQTYCTSHIAFCIPVHKNWYFKSFGATTSNRWHVELGMSDIEELGDGAIILNLVSGSSASMQAQDGQIKTQGNDIIGFKDWQDGTHFELIADARLRTAVEYMLANITPYAGAQ